jgi:hypothetical protein
MVLPSRRAFFKAQPSHALPGRDRNLVALDRAPGQLLTAEAQLAQDPPNVSGMIPLAGP